MPSQSAEHVADLWLDYFSHPSQWWDIRKKKTNPKAPDFRHKISKERLWIDNRFNPIWLQDRLLEGHTREIASSYSDEETQASVEEILSSFGERVPSIDMIASLLNKCTNQRLLLPSLSLHAHMHNMGLENHISLGNLLVSLLVEVGQIQEAQQLFDKLLYRNECSWNSLISGYAKHGEPHRALLLYHEMKKDDSLKPSMYTYVALLKACANLKDSKRGCEIHSEIASKSLLETNVFIGSSLLHMYAQCGFFEKAQEVFHKLPVRDRVAWNTLITGFIENERAVEACQAFEQMQLEGVSPDSITFVGILKAYSKIGAMEKAQEIHAQIDKSGKIESIAVATALVDMYVQNGLLAKAQHVFENFQDRNVMLWTALIAGYAEHGYSLNALDSFDKMKLEGVSPDPLAFVYILKACGALGNAGKARQLHGEICNMCFDRDMLVSSSLVDMYAKCGLLEEAQYVFDKLNERNIISWNALIGGYAEHGSSEAVFECFNQMLTDGIPPDAITFVYILKAYGNIGAMKKSQEMHMEITKKGLERDVALGTALVELYCKNGFLKTACQLFEKLEVRTVVTWNALIGGYTQLGECENVFKTFEKMKEGGEKPNLITFQNLLNVCSHAGLVDEAQLYMKSMSKEYGIKADLEHYTCIVDALCRAGQVHSAITMIKDIPFSPDLVVWHSILGGCSKWGEVELGRHAFEYALLLDEKDVGTYVCMHNIYADNVVLKDARKR